MGKSPPTGLIIFDHHDHAAQSRMALASAFARMGLFTAFGRGLSDAFDVEIPSDADLLIFLRNKLAIARAASGRSTWFGGRFYNQWVGEDPAYVELSGCHIDHVLNLVGQDAPVPLEYLKTYGLRRDVVEDVVDLLENRLK